TYLTSFEDLLARHELTAMPFGHFGEGCLHVRMDFPFDRPDGADRFRAFLEDAADLVTSLGGSLSGEHGDGRLRAGLLERFFGPEVVALFRAVKRSYDPRGILNPGVILPAADWAPLAGLKVGAGAALIPDDIAARLREIEQTGGWAVPKTELAR
ncbi:MAG: FAD-binding oxidoreductase, partial [Acidimicrobiales bacterium]